MDLAAKDTKEAAAPGEPVQDKDAPVDLAKDKDEPADLVKDKDEATDLVEVCLPGFTEFFFHCPDLIPFWIISKYVTTDPVYSVF